MIIAITGVFVEYLQVVLQKDKQNAITVSDIFPIIAPNKAPTPVVIPDNITYIITLLDFIPPFFIGTAIEIPSGR